MSHFPRHKNFHQYEQYALVAGADFKTTYRHPPPSLPTLPFSYASALGSPRAQLNNKTSHSDIAADLYSQPTSQETSNIHSTSRTAQLVQYYETTSDDNTSTRSNSPILFNQSQKTQEAVHKSQVPFDPRLTHSKAKRSISLLKAPFTDTDLTPNDSQQNTNIQNHHSPPPHTSNTRNTPKPSHHQPPQTSLHPSRELEISDNETLNGLDPQEENNNFHDPQHDSNGFTDPHDNNDEINSWQFQKTKTKPNKVKHVIIDNIKTNLTDERLIDKTKELLLGLATEVKLLRRGGLSITPVDNGHTLNKILKTTTYPKDIYGHNIYVHFTQDKTDLRKWLCINKIPYNQTTEDETLTNIKQALTDKLNAHTDDNIKIEGLHRKISGQYPSTLILFKTEDSISQKTLTDTLPSYGKTPYVTFW